MLESGAALAAEGPVVVLIILNGATHLLWARATQTPTDKQKLDAMREWVCT